MRTEKAKRRCWRIEERCFTEEAILSGSIKAMHEENLHSSWLMSDEEGRTKEDKETRRRDKEEEVKSGRRKAENEVAIGSVSMFIFVFQGTRLR